MTEHYKRLMSYLNIAINDYISFYKDNKEYHCTVINFNDKPLLKYHHSSETEDIGILLKLKYKVINRKYDYLIVGSGLFGSVCAYELSNRGYKVLVIDKRNHIGGNIYTEKIENITCHKYGPHIFHTSNESIWNYINKFSKFNNFINSPLAKIDNKVYNLPFNMNMFSRIFRTTNPAIVKDIIDKEIKDANIKNPKNLEQQAISLVGTTIYLNFIKEYTEKQWNKACTSLPPDIIKRIPLRFTYDNNYFNDKYQGIPVDGYTSIIEKMLANSEVLLEEDFFSKKDYYLNIASKIIYTGMIDKFFDYEYGKLEYRSLRFENEILDTDNYQGNAVVNYIQKDVAFTRLIEHKHFNNDISSKTVITREFPEDYNSKKEPYYSINNKSNNDLYNQYLDKSKTLSNVFFGGRLGSYKYLNMDEVIKEALDLIDILLTKERRI